MDSSRTRVVLALALYTLSLVEYKPAFAAATSWPAGLSGAASMAAGRGSSALPGWTNCGLRVAAATLAISAYTSGPRPNRTQRRVDASGLVATGPITVYTNALMDAAGKKNESVPVAKDVMKIKSLFNDEAFLDQLTLIVNQPGQTVLEKASDMVKLMQPLESTVMEKFVTFLAKKKRLLALKPICKEFVSTLYSNQSIAPVVLRTAERLSEKQLAGIKEKMKVKTGARDILLVQKVDASLMGGFIVEWGFLDPKNLTTPTDGIDLSLKTILAKAAISKGVIPEP